MATGLMLKKLVLKNLLSFGPEGVELELGPFNVLIGPNASGKSNLIDAIRLLAACPKDVTEPVVLGGGRVMATQGQDTNRNVRHNGGDWRTNLRT